MKTRYDQEQQRCPMLGHEIKLEYCRSMNSQLPCRKILDCWFERLPIVDFVRENYGEKIMAKLAEPPKAKIVSLIELIEQAKQNNFKE